MAPTVLSPSTPGIAGPLGNSGGVPPGAGGPPHDIQGLLPYVRPWQTYALWAAIACASLALLVALYLWWRRRQAKPAAPPKPIDPWDALDGRLRALAPLSDFGRKAQEEYFFQLSMLLREGVELRTRIPATDLTLQELREPVRRKLPLASHDIEAMLGFLERADHVKFAEAESNRAEAERCAGQVRVWVTALRPRATVVDGVVGTGQGSDGGGAGGPSATGGDGISSVAGTAASGRASI